MTADENLRRLEQLLSEMSSVLVCFSGGIDSALVLAVANRQLGDNAVGLTAVSPSLAESEREGAQRLAAQIGARHHFVNTHEIKRDGYAANGPDRCFHCKTELYAVALEKRKEWQLEVIVNGTNVDDLGDYRPGLDAAREAQVRSPLVELSMGKKDVREMARQLGLSIWDKPASACLSSRIPYGTRVTEERLAQIDALESDLRERGFRQLRVRWHDTIARIEVDTAELSRFLDPELRAAVVELGKRRGFAYVTIDLAGYRTGSHNEVLEGRRLRVLP